MAEAERSHAWRARAAELRKFAEQANDPVARHTLQELADTWDDMAERVERRLKGDVVRLRTN